MERLRGATIAAVAEAGYAAVTVSDIVRRARVSRAAFYASYEDKEACFLDATREGREQMMGRVVNATRAQPADTADEEVFRVGVRAFLAFLADEPAFARVFYVDMPAAGPRAVDRLHVAGLRFAAMTGTWHKRARTRHPEWPAVPDDAYLALEGAIAELVRNRVREDRTKTLPELEETVVRLHLAVLAGQAWPESVLGHSPMPPSFSWPLSRLRAIVRRWISSVPS